MSLNDEQPAKYKVDTLLFLEWYFSDRSDAQIMGYRVKSELMSNKSFSITIKTLFDEVAYIPAWIIKDYHGEQDDELDPSLCELV